LRLFRAWDAYLEQACSRFGEQGWNRNSWPICMVKCLVCEQLLTATSLMLLKCWVAVTCAVQCPRGVVCGLCGGASGSTLQLSALKCRCGRAATPAGPHVGATCRGLGGADSICKPQRLYPRDCGAARPWVVAASGTLGWLQPAASLRLGYMPACSVC